MSEVQASEVVPFDARNLMPDVDRKEIDIIHPTTKKKTGIKITVLSRDSDTYRDLQKAQANVRFKQFGKRTTSASLTAEELEEESIQLLVACTVGWKNMFYDGKSVEFNQDNVRMIYERVTTIREQVDEAIHDRSNFKTR